MHDHVAMTMLSCMIMINCLNYKAHLTNSFIPRVHNIMNSSLYNLSTCLLKLNQQSVFYCVQVQRYTTMSEGIVLECFILKFCVAQQASVPHECYNTL